MVECVIYVSVETREYVSKIKKPHITSPTKLVPVYLLCAINFQRYTFDKAQT